jgi:hypothetical protein
MPAQLESGGGDASFEELPVAAGPSDILARLTAQKLSEHLGEQYVSGYATYLCDRCPGRRTSEFVKGFGRRPPDSRRRSSSGRHPKPFARADVPTKSIDDRQRRQFGMKSARPTTPREN